jgi:hypothetical protein
MTVFEPLTMTAMLEMMILMIGRQPKSVVMGL